MKDKQIIMFIGRTFRAGELCRYVAQSFKKAID